MPISLSNQSYDLLKWLVMVLAPACAVLISGLGELYYWEGAPVAVATINLFNAFLGSLLQLSSRDYQHKEEALEELEKEEDHG